MITPRQYQLDAVDGVFDYWREHPGKSPLVCMSTGSGKSIVIALLIQRLLSQYARIQVLLMVHRREIIEQLENSVRLVWPDAPVGVVSASLKRNEFKQITIAGRDTIATKLSSLSGYAPHLCIVDEAHLIPQRETARYQKIISELQSRNEIFKILGFTATPYRASSGLIYGDDEDQLFDGLAYQIGMRKLLDMGMLWPIKTLDVVKSAKIDTSAVPITAGEFNLKKLNEASNQHHLVQMAIADWYKQAWLTGRKHTLFYCVSIAHCQAVQKELALYDLVMPILIGTTPGSEREKIIDDFRSRKLPGIVSVSAITEGSDLVNADCLVLLRAIRSIGLYVQVMGRLMRVDEQCPHSHGLVLDYSGTVEALGCVDIAQPPVKRNKRNTVPRTKVCPKCNAIVGFFCIKCIEPCEHRFKPKVHKVCPNCQAHCDPREGECITCGHLFVSHGTHASHGELIADRERYLRVNVTGMTSHVRQSKKTGLPYLVVTYETEIVTLVVNVALVYGLGGAAAERPLRQWQRMVRDDIGAPIPTDADQAYRIGFAWHQEHWRPVESIVIDQYSPFKTIVMVNYKETTAHERDHDFGSDHAPPVQPGDHLGARA